MNEDLGFALVVGALYVSLVLGLNWIIAAFYGFTFSGHDRIRKEKK